MPLTTTGAAGFIAGGPSEEKTMAQKNEDKKRFKVVSGFCIGDGVNVFPGAVIELSEADGRKYVGMEYVISTDEPVGEAPIDKNHRKLQTQGAGAVRNRDPR